ncbi:MAG: DUF4012 domain-containing protein [bacterium]
MPRKIKTKRRQVRRCSVCGKIGHNKSTCIEINAPVQKQIIDKMEKPPLKFFVHHVDHGVNPSSHIIDLKKHSIWNEVQSIAPETNHAKNYHHYHNQPVKPNLANKNLLSPAKSFEFLNQTKNKTCNKKIQVSGLRQPVLKNKLAEIKIGFTNTQRDFFWHVHNWQKIYMPLRRTLISILIFSLIIFAPTQAQTYYQSLKLTANDIASKGINGFKSLQESTGATMEGDIDNAQVTLSQAMQDFNQAVEELNNKHKWLQDILSYIPVINKTVKSRQSVIEVGHNISLGNGYLLKTINEIKASKDPSLLKNIEVASDNLKLGLPYYQKAQKDLNQIQTEIIPAKYQEQFSQFKPVFNAFVNDLAHISNSAQALQEIFGGQGLRRYLLIFQNPHEIRATGGFMGSFALMEIKNGKIINLDVPAGGTYDVQGQLNKFVEPPTPLLMVNDQWHFHDANWFPDFPASAQKILWFYQHSRNITADGVIAINAEVLDRILELTGPITDEKRGLVLTNDNAIDTIQKIVETCPEKKDNKPKQIISDLAPKFIEYFQNINSQDILPFLNHLQQALTQKEIQLYFTDSKPQQAMDGLGWDGKILHTKNNQDYLFVVNTNINGRKSDAKIKQTTSHQAVVQSDGSIINTVTITRQHTGEKGIEFYGYPNIDYMRIYVPEGSELISAGGFTWINDKHFKAPKKWCEKDLDLTNLEKEVKIDPLNGTRITNEFGKTAFANWVVTEPGQASQVYFTYQLPFKITEQEIQPKNKWLNLIQTARTNAYYQLVVQKQSGINGDFESNLIFPTQWKPLWHNGQQVKLASNGASINKNQLTQDMVWSLIMTK